MARNNKSSDNDQLDDLRYSCRLCGKEISLSLRNAADRKRNREQVIEQNIKPICAKCKRVEAAVQRTGLFSRDDVTHDRSRKVRPR